MKLTIDERLLLGNVLTRANRPPHGTSANLKVVRDARMALSFSEEEHKRFKFTTGKDGKTRWFRFEMEKDKKTGELKPREVNGEMIALDETAEVKIGEKALDIIVLLLTDAEKRGELNEDSLPLFERFVEKKDPVAVETAPAE